jgi:hypothetical protein
MSDTVWLENLPSLDIRIPPGKQTPATAASLGGDVVALAQIHDRWFILLGLYPNGFTTAERRRYVMGGQPDARRMVQHFAGPGIITRVNVARPKLIVISDDMDWAWSLLEHLQAGMIQTELCGLFRFHFLPAEQPGILNVELTVKLVKWDEIYQE